MKTTYYSEQPQSYSILKVGNNATIIFTTNITSYENSEGSTAWKADTYELSAKYNDNLDSRIRDNYEEWLNKAKNDDKTQTATMVRAQRDKLLMSSDYIMCADSPFTAEQKNAWMAYRQNLRDIPEQTGFPYDINWPEKP